MAGNSEEHDLSDAHGNSSRQKLSYIFYINLYFSLPKIFTRAEARDLFFTTCQLLLFIESAGYAAHNPTASEWSIGLLRLLLGWGSRSNQ